MKVILSAFDKLGLLDNNKWNLFKKLEFESEVGQKTTIIEVLFAIILNIAIFLPAFHELFNIFDEIDKDKVIKEVMKKLNIDDKIYPTGLIKAEKPKEEEQKEVKRIQDGKPLTKVEDKKEDILGTTGPAKKKGKKKKEKDVNQQEIDLNAELGAHLQIGESYERGPRRGGRGGRGWRGQGRGGRGRGKGRGGGFVYNPEDFPELK